jgi:hypothetical protein
MLGWCEMILIIKLGNEMGISDAHMHACPLAPTHSIARMGTGTEQSAPSECRGKETGNRLHPSREWEQNRMRAHAMGHEKSEERKKVWYWPRRALNILYIHHLSATPEPGTPAPTERARSVVGTGTDTATGIEQSRGAHAFVHREGKKRDGES